MEASASSTASASASVTASVTASGASVQCTPSSSSSSGAQQNGALVKYGELLILGYNGTLPQGDRGRRRSKFVLYRRQKANGVRRSRHYKVRTPQSSGANLNNQVHAISYTLNRNHSVIVEYEQDDNSDLFQIGRSSESPIDFVVMDTVPGNKVQDRVNAQSTISRFACRIITDRTELECKIYAAGWDSSRNIFLGEKTTKWEKENGQVDGLTTNGILIMHPKGEFCPRQNSENEPENGDRKTQQIESKPGIWREISIDGNVFGLRESRSATKQGPAVSEENNTLIDGTLIDMCGATLLWRSNKGLEQSPTPKQLDNCLENLNAGRPQCPVGLHTLVVPTRKSSSQVAPEAQPVVYLGCGHVQGRHGWGNVNDSKGSKNCPLCFVPSSLATLMMGCEPGFYVDCNPPDYCFVPCGHMASERTVKYWANVPIPCGTSGFQSACPFCAVPLTGTPGYVKLIFQDKCD